MRDDFSKAIKRNLAERVAWLCSNPDCRVVTVGPHTDPTKRVSVGQACHIEAASEGGPRYNKEMQKAQRCSFDNGIWLCSIHAREIDVDADRFSVELLRKWKFTAEQYAQNKVGKARDDVSLDVFTENVNRHRELFSNIRDIEYFNLHRNENDKCLTLRGVGPLNIIVKDRRVDISFKEVFNSIQCRGNSIYIGLICLPVKELIDYVVLSHEFDETIESFNVTFNFSPNQLNEMYFSIRTDTINVNPYKDGVCYHGDYTVENDKLIDDLGRPLPPFLEDIYLKIIVVSYNIYRRIVTFTKE
ncbi:hypothetical protein AB6D37_14755 [Pectobacterium brasiliense]|uniref:hypothetical protein n=1 Tax=Pectobacterium brasiliense TaxID=180957 RepID=UPI0039875A8C